MVNLAKEWEWLESFTSLPTLLTFISCLLWKRYVINRTCFRFALEVTYHDLIWLDHFVRGCLRRAAWYQDFLEDRMFQYAAIFFIDRNNNIGYRIVIRLSPLLTMKSAGGSSINRWLLEMILSLFSVVRWFLQGNWLFCCLILIDFHGENFLSTFTVINDVHNVHSRLCNNHIIEVL